MCILGNDYYFHDIGSVHDLLNLFFWIYFDLYFQSTKKATRQKEDRG